MNKHDALADLYDHERHVRLLLGLAIVAMLVSSITLVLDAFVVSALAMVGAYGLLTMAPAKYDLPIIAGILVTVIGSAVMYIYGYVIKEQKPQRLYEKWSGEHA